MAKPLNTDTRSWVEVKPGSDFPIQNLPFGVFKTEERSPRAGIALGEKVIELIALAEAGYFDELKFDRKVLLQPVLNPLIGLGKDVTSKMRLRVAELFDEKFAGLKEHRAALEKCLVPMKEVTMLLPVHVPDYTDFYSSIDHAFNMGKMFRDPENALLPNWKHIPVGYHGRASSIVVSGTHFHRPKGQMKPADAEVPVFGPTKLLDFELETAFIISKPTHLGDTIECKRADEYIFGMVLFNDWSARDIQSWEYVPLGPFLGKNFCSVVSPWIVTLEALEPFRVVGYVQDPPVLPYLEGEPERNVDIKLEVAIKPEKGEETVVTRSNYRYMYWTMEQQLAHHTVNGCNVNVGDMMASGTISGPEEGSYGSMMEITWRGTKPIAMSDGTERKFINDGDTVIMRGHCELNGVRIGFGECASTVLPTK